MTLNADDLAFLREFLLKQAKLLDDADSRLIPELRAPRKGESAWRGEAARCRLIATQIGQRSPTESYPLHWLHVSLHLDPTTLLMNSEGDHRIRQWIEQLIKCYDGIEGGESALWLLRSCLQAPNVQEG